MDLMEIDDVDIEIHQISDKDFFPGYCALCESRDVICRTHVLHDLWELGSPGIARVLRHKKILWECKNCKQRFYILNPKVPFNSSYTDEVKSYVFSRVLKKGDSMNRVAKDLNELHNVKIHVSTISKWITELQAEDEEAIEEGDDIGKLDHSGILSLDGTFKTVKPKKNARGRKGDEPSWLRLTRSKDGRLVAILPLENVKKN
jgi:hypothetical protein